jgi:hypothetical protein
MKLETIESMWAADAKIDPLDLGQQALYVPQLHSKWYKVYLQERLTLKKQEHDWNQLKNDRYQFYDGSLDDETLTERGWLQEFRSFSKKILKSDINRYLDADKIIAEAALKVAYQKEKVLFLESILDNIKYRGNAIRSAIEWAKFSNGI